MTARQQQRIDDRDPTVAAFIKDCGLATTPVAIKLPGENREDVALQIGRLKDAFGSLIAVTEPRQVSNGIEWIAHGTLLA